jgi:hypothetical protein
VLNQFAPTSTGFYFRYSQRSQVQPNFEHYANERPPNSVRREEVLHRGDRRRGRFSISPTIV